MFLDTVSGNDLDRNVGPMTLAEMAAAAARMRSFSTRILGRLGTIVERIPTTSSALSFGSLAMEDFRDSTRRFSERLLEFAASAKLVGRVVKIAVSNRRNKS